MSVSIIAFHSRRKIDISIVKIFILISIILVPGKRRDRRRLSEKELEKNREILADLTENFIDYWHVTEEYFCQFSLI